jgi:phosphatidate phosphatase PAH1
MATNEDQNKAKETDNTDWKLKFNDLIQTAQSEIKKTTQIGIKMLSASQSNAKLHETYEDIGKWYVDKFNSGELKTEDEKIINLVGQVKELQEQLEGFEKDVQDIKEK